MVGRPARREQADGRIDDRLFIDAMAERAVIIAVPANRGDAVDRSTGQFLPQLVARMTKALAGTCSPIISIIIWLLLAVP